MSQNIANKFSCKYCDYITSNKYDFSKHVLTAKHLRNEMDIKNRKMSQKSQEKSQDQYALHCCFCRKGYKSSSGLWKHRRLCEIAFQKSECGEAVADNECQIVQNKVEENSYDIGALSNRELVLELLRDNKEMRKIILDLSKTSALNSNNQIHNTNSHNKTFNLQFFLNETCKDAMNISDFVDNICLKLSDLERFGHDGYADGISHVLVRELKNVDVTKRPIHCSDVKRETLYVKENNAWEKESEDHPNLTKVIKSIEQKNINMLSDYQKAHPDFMDYDSRTNTEYNKIIINSIGSFTDEEGRLVHNRIVGKISEATAIPKAGAGTVGLS